MPVNIVFPSFLRVCRSQGTAYIYKPNGAKDILRVSYVIISMMAKQGLGEGEGMYMQPQTIPLATHGVTECGDCLASHATPVDFVTPGSKVTHFPGFLLKQMGGSPKPNFDACTAAGREQMVHASPRKLVSETFLESINEQLPEKPAATDENTVSCCLTTDTKLTDGAVSLDQEDSTEEVSSVYVNSKSNKEPMLTTAEVNTEDQCAQVTQHEQLSRDKMMPICSASGLKETSKSQPSHLAVPSKLKKTVLPASLLTQVTSVVKQVFGAVHLNTVGDKCDGTCLMSSENPGGMNMTPGSSVDSLHLECDSSHNDEACSVSSDLTISVSESTSLSALDQKLSQQSCVLYTDRLEIMDKSCQINKQTDIHDVCSDETNAASDTAVTLPATSCITDKCTETFKELPEPVDASHGATSAADNSSLRKRNMDSTLSCEDGCEKEGKKRRKMQKGESRTITFQAVSEVLQMLRAESCGKENDTNLLVNKDGTDTKQTGSDTLDSNVGSTVPAGGDDQNDETSNKKNKTNGMKKKQLKLSKAGRSSGTKAAPNDVRSNDKALWDELPQYIPESDSRMVKKKKKNKDKVYDLSALFSGTLGPPKKPRPNYFLAVQITNSEIKDGLSKVLAAVEEADKKVKPAFISMTKLHITLTVMNLPDEDTINRAKTALDEFRQKMNEETTKEEVQALTFDVTGLGNFRHQVVFAKVAEGPSLDRLSEIAALVRASMVDKHIKLLSEFTPHITIMKMSKGIKELKRQGVKKIEEQLYKDFSDKHFGPQVAEKVQLCAMKKSNVDDYYHVEHEVPL